MLKPFLFVLLSILSVSASAVAHHSNNQNPEYQQLAKQPYWRHLLHFHQSGLITDSGSQIDDPGFFIAANGKQDAYAELVASINLFLSADKADQDRQCRYPARLAWLSQQLPELQFTKPDCPEFDSWFASLSAEQVILTFPASYLNSPSSMYGHTLFRLKKKGNDNALLDYAVNYAANADPDDNQLVFSYKGLTGGYPGVVSVMPYYQKVQEYNYLESRNIWEYQLDLTQQEVDQFVRHVWEMKSTYMDYFFFTENCSYQLLSLLDASSARLDLTQNFKLRAIPTDTIRVLATQGLIKQTEFRPSILTQLDNMLAQTRYSDIELAKFLVDEAEPDFTLLANYSAEQQAKILDVAYQYSRYLSARKKSTLSHLDARSIKLLSLRSKNINGDVFKPVAKPQVRDDQGHATQRVILGAGFQGNRNYLNLGYRASYHELLDLPQGYLSGAQLEMASLSLRWYQQESIKLQQLDLLHIRSLSAKNALFTPKSWQVRLGLDRIPGLDDELVAKLDGGAGATLLVGEHYFAGFLNGEFYLDDDLRDRYYLAAGPQLTWLWQGSGFNIIGQYQYLFHISGHSLSQQKADISWAYHLSDDWQLRIGAHYYDSKNREESGAALSVVHYY